MFNLPFLSSTATDRPSFWWYLGDFSSTTSTAGRFLLGLRLSSSELQGLPRNPLETSSRRGRSKPQLGAKSFTFFYALWEGLSCLTHVFWKGFQPPTRLAEKLSSKLFDAVVQAGSLLNRWAVQKHLDTGFCFVFPQRLSSI